MHTIALVSRKGGTGKSTLAIGLAVAAMEVGHKVCLLEADPLGTVSNWRRRRTSVEPTVEVIHDGCMLFHRVQALAHRGIALTIVDTAGGWSDACTGAMAAADLCLIPTRPSPADIDAAAPMLAAVRESGKPFAFVLNQVQARSTRLNSAAGSLGKRAIELKMSHVLALPAIVLRNDQQDALGIGLGVTEYAPGGKSAEEIRGLWRWIGARREAAPRSLARKRWPTRRRHCPPCGRWRTRHSPCPPPARRAVSERSLSANGGRGLNDLACQSELRHPSDDSSSAPSPPHPPARVCPKERGRMCFTTVRPRSCSQESFVAYL